jgi:predicted secreted hydrolase
MNCLFKADPRKISIPIVEKIPAKEVYFSHSIISDISKKKIFSKTNPISILSKDSFSKEDLFVNYLNPSPMGYVNNVIEINNGIYHIKTENLDLNLKPKGKHFLHHGNGVFSFKKKRVYYYSFTDMEVEGTLILNGKPIEVKGKAWMDHEWAGFAGEKNWNWFSIQLDNKTGIMIHDYNNKENVYVGIDRKGRGEFTDDLVLVPKAEWKSPLTGAKYPTEWNIYIPSKSINLIAKAPVKQQEVLFGSLNYWEGPIDISGTIKGKKVKGLGFMELTGRKAEKSKMALYEHQIKSEAKWYMDFAKKEFIHYWKNRNRK